MTVLGLLVSVQAAPLSLVVKAEAVSVAGGLALPGMPGSGSIGAFNARVGDVAVGMRFAPRYAAVLGVTAIDGIASRYLSWSDWPPLALGVAVLRSVPLNESPRAVLMFGSVRGSNGWGWSGSHRYLDLAVGANATFWAVSPEFELGWRREWRPSGTAWEEYPPNRDCLFAMVRAGLGGWYEFRLPWAREEH